MISLGVPPVKGKYRITSYYGSRTPPIHGASSFHAGIDLVCIGIANAEIIAVSDGIVRIAENRGVLGNYIVMEHPAGFLSIYQHLKSFSVYEGQAVKAGIVIGIMGNTGVGTGVHLHFGLEDIPFSQFTGTSKNTTNPLDYLLRVSKFIGNNVYEPTVNTPYSQIPGSVASNNIQNGAVKSDIEKWTYEQVEIDATQQKQYEKLFGRKYRIVISDKSGIGIDISQLHVTFDITKKMTADCVVSSIIIYNLNTLTESKIIQDGARITVEAGYEGSFGLIYDGDIIQAIRYKENGTDYVVKILAMSGDRFLNEGFEALSISRGQTKRQVIENVTNGVPSGEGKLGSISQVFDKQKYIRGKVVFGGASDYLKQIARSDSADFYIADGKINLTSMKDLPEGEILHLDSTSGLIGVPSQTQVGCDFKCLLTPRIKLNSLVHIDLKNIQELEYNSGLAAAYLLDKSGVFRIIEIQYSGDTRGTQWYCSCQAINQSGNLPQVLANQITL